jgi:hypothetical protein
MISIPKMDTGMMITTMAGTRRTMMVDTKTWMVAGEGMDTSRQIKAIPHNKNIMEVIEGVEAPCRQRHPMALEADSIREVVVKAEDTPRMAVL